MVATLERWWEYISGKTRKMVKTFKLRASKREPHVICKGVWYDGTNCGEMIDFVMREGDKTMMEARDLTNEIEIGQWLMHFRPYAFVVRGEGDVQGEWEEWVEDSPALRSAIVREMDYVGEVKKAFKADYRNNPQPTFMGVDLTDIEFSSLVMFWHESVRLDKPFVSLSEVMEAYIHSKNGKVK